MKKRSGLILTLYFFIVFISGQQLHSQAKIDQAKAINAIAIIAEYIQHMPEPAKEDVFLVNSIVWIFNSIDREIPDKSLITKDRNYIIDEIDNGTSVYYPIGTPGSYIKSFFRINDQGTSLVFYMANSNTQQPIIATISVYSLGNDQEIEKKYTVPQGGEITIGSIGDTNHFIYYIRKDLRF